mgnify:CR=1 FL=1
MLMKGARAYIVLTLVFTALMSLPFLVEGAGWTALFGLVPLLEMEYISHRDGTRHFWLWSYLALVLWNAVTTWWVGNATVGGAVFAVLANALQMELVFAAFRFVRRRTGGAFPYIFLAAAWIAWERYYLAAAEISWPWLVLGNAFAGTTSLAQWYEYTGHLGGSLWVWMSNLAIFDMLHFFRDGRWKAFNIPTKVFSVCSSAVFIIGPVVCSLALGAHLRGESVDPVDVVIVQPDFDPYQKFQSMSQAQQNDVFIDLAEKGLSEFPDDSPVLVLAPETFTGDIVTSRIPQSPTFRTFQEFLHRHGNANILFGASTYDVADYRTSILAREYGDMWLTSHNSAIMTDSTGRHDLFHKSKLVVGTELTPYPRFFVPLENLLGGDLMGKCVGQDEVTTLDFRACGKSYTLGSVICYESVYGEYCTQYVRKGAQLLAVITNDAWWGDSPGYRQHLNYSRLRAIETRRDIVRCANTGISAFIDRKGNITSASPWWERTVMTGKANLSDRETFFVRHGDFVGRISVFAAALLFLGALLRRGRNGNRKKEARR